MPGGALVEVWSDLACPWCYVGKRRLDAALARLPAAAAVDVRWHPYLIDAGTDPQGVPSSCRDATDRVGVRKGELPGRHSTAEREEYRKNTRCSLKLTLYRETRTWVQSWIAIWPADEISANDGRSLAAGH